MLTIPSSVCGGIRGSHLNGNIVTVSLFIFLSRAVERSVCLSKIVGQT